MRTTAARPAMATTSRPRGPGRAPTNPSRRHVGAARAGSASSERHQSRLSAASSGPCRGSDPRSGVAPARRRSRPRRSVPRVVPDRGGRRPAARRLDRTPRPGRAGRGGGGAEADASIAEGTPIRLRTLASEAGLTDLDVELLVIALVPDLDSRFERLYGYLNDDVTRRRATVGLALSLADVSSASSTARARLLPGAPLIDRALVQVEDADRPFLTRALRVPDRVAAHLLGDDAADPALVGPLTDPVPFAGEQAVRLARALSAGQRLIYVREAGIGIGPSVAAAALQAIGRPVVGVDLARAAAGREPEQAVAVLGREALLRGAGVVAGPVEAFSEGHAEALRLLADLPLPVTIVGTVTWDPNWTDSVPLVIDAPTLSPTERIALWATELGAGTPGEASADGPDSELD